MSEQAQTPELLSTYIADIISVSSIHIDPHLFSYFTRLTPFQWKLAKQTASKLLKAYPDSKYSCYLSNYLTVEKAGEILVQTFFDYYYPDCYTCNMLCDPSECTFTFKDRAISVHTRLLKTQDNITTDGFRINTRKFFPMIPELGMSRPAELYLFCGFDVMTMDGFVFGWSDAADIQKVHMDYSLQTPAKCIPIPNLRPLTLLP